MKKCILHVGLHKTATSSIQETLANNLDTLKNNGFIYPIFTMNNNNIVNHSIPIFSCFTENPEDYHINKRFKINIQKQNKIFLDQLDSSLRSEMNLIISGEDISILSLDGLIKLKEHIKQFDYELDVHCVIRSPYSLLCSLVQQNIKGGLPSLNELSCNKTSKIIEKLDIVFDKVNYHSFSNLKSKKNSLVLNTISKFGISGELIEHSSNESLGNKTSRLLNYINLKNPVFNNDGTINSSRQGNHHFHSDINCDNDRFFLTREEFEIVKYDIHSENDYLKNKFGDEYCDQEYNFSSNDVIDEEFSINAVNKFKNQPNIIKKSVYDYLKSHKSVKESILLPLFGDEELITNFELLRNTAIVWEKSNIQNATYFMELARELRPHGPLVLSKLKEYKKKHNIPNPKK